MKMSLSLLTPCASSGVPHIVGGKISERIKGMLEIREALFSLTVRRTHTLLKAAYNNYGNDKPDERNQVLWKATKQVNCGNGKERNTVKYPGQFHSTFLYQTFIFCQYFPPGNTNAGAENIGEVADNVGDLITIPCKKPTVANATVTPESDSVNPGETYTVTCDEGFVVNWDEIKILKHFTCNIDGSLSPKRMVICKKVVDDVPAGSPEHSALSISVMILAVLALMFP